MSQPVAFQITKASCVAVGTFNIYIIQPGWLAKVNILPKAPVRIEANLTRPGFRFFSPETGPVWIVSPGKLSVESRTGHEDCGRYVAAVLKKLSWTPVSAVGNNVTLRADRTTVETFPALEASLASAVVPDDATETQRAFGISIAREKRVFNLNVTVKADAVELIGNANTKTEETDTTEAAANAAESFQQDVKTLMDLFSEVLGVQIGDVVSPSGA